MRFLVEVGFAGQRLATGACERTLLALRGVPEPGGGLRYVGSVAPTRAPDLATKLRAIEESCSPFTAGPVPKKTSTMHWARPELVADVEIAEFTASGKMRQAAFKRLRTDKTAAEVNPDFG